LHLKAGGRITVKLNRGEGMSDRWYRGGIDPKSEFYGAPFMTTIEAAGMDVATHLLTQPEPLTRFKETEEALSKRKPHFHHSLGVAKMLQSDFDRRGSEITEEDLKSACAELDEVDAVLRGRDHIVSVFGERFIACLGGFSILGSMSPVAVSLRMTDASVSQTTTSMRRMQRIGEPHSVPVRNVENIWPYER
jgi:hypothetical protein